MIVTVNVSMIIMHNDEYSNNAINNDEYVSYNDAGCGGYGNNTIAGEKKNNITKAFITSGITRRKEAVIYNSLSCRRRAGGDHISC